MKKDDIKKLKAVVIKYAGPLGEFVVDKTLKDIGALNESNTRSFVKEVMRRAIFDPERRDRAIKEAFEALGLKK